MKKQMERKKGMARLLELAFIKKGLSISACVLSVISVVASFSPYIAIYFIIRELITHFTDLNALDTAYMVRLAWIAAGGAGVAILFNWFALLCSHIAAFNIIYKLKLDFMRHIASLPLGFHTATSTGKLRKVIDENIEKLEGFIAHQLPDLAGSVAAPISALVILFIFDWRMGIASFVPIVASYVIQMVAFGSKPAQIFITKYQDSLDDMNTAAVEYVRGVSVVKAFNQTIFSFHKFHETIVTYGSFVKNYTAAFKTHMTLFLTIVHHVYIFLLPIIILLADGSAPGNAVDYGNFVISSLFYIIYSFSLATPFVKMMYVAGNGRQIADGVGRMDAILDLPPLAEPVNPKTANEYSVSFENVTFSYNVETEAVALQGVSFTAKQGEITALVGPSGGGKSTIAHLIPRFYDVAEGAVKIGGVDVRDMGTEYLTSLVSFVFQDVFLFKQSIADNISVGDKDATREEVVAAAKAAQCHEFIEKLPKGYDTIIGAENTHLSGGEKQRIVIARAILKDAPILVFDEATSFADPENEHKIQLAFEKLMKDKTVIIIAHRLSTVRGANKILVIEKGKVVEEGGHDLLLTRSGRYSRMWERYNAALGWALAGVKGEKSCINY
ncbi:MAG: ABC transporter ATP-binding protein/permease [Treponema sp.]|jgi:ATP-binding cassette subfamily B protein|nr:ABC transporter ATP-binding protein/permease [Treponema sp.]